MFALTICQNLFMKKTYNTLIFKNKKPLWENDTKCESVTECIEPLKLISQGQLEHGLNSATMLVVHACG